MHRVFKTRYFQRWMRKTELTDGLLCRAVREMASGLVDAELGGGVVKKRIGLPGRRKSGGTRTLVATNRNELWFFIFGFEKNARSNITEKELEALQTIADDLLHLTPEHIADRIENQSLWEICHADSSQSPQSDPGSRP